jgi:acyl-CoA thioester hydrolase
MNEMPLNGWWDGKIHVYPIRVYYADTDAGGVVYHAKYLDFAERARTEMMRLTDENENYRTNGKGILFVVRKAEIDYRKPALLDDVLAVRTEVAELGGASFSISQQICRTETILAMVRITLVCVREMGHPSRMPESLREKLAGLLSEGAI